jgi:penicillin amidase
MLHTVRFQPTAAERTRGPAIWKWARRIAGAVLAVALLAGGGLYLYLRASLPQTSGRLHLTGLQAQVDIVRDAHGVPHIFAQYENDAWYALGFLHAQDRLFQMEMVRRIAQGRLAEVIGARGLRSDRFMRVLGLEQMAADSLAALPAEARAEFEAYTAGVNAFLGQGHSLPPEFLISRHTPEPWRLVDCLLWSRLMALQLTGNWRDELARARLAATLPAGAQDELWPTRPADNATTLAALTPLYRQLGLEQLAAALPEPLGPSKASNEWVVSGEHTVSRKPLLVNDPHLSLGAPGQWYLVRIVTPQLTLTGATAPGAPAVVLGHNGRIAWGFTTTGADTFDLFVERLDPHDPTHYLSPDGPRPFDTRTEVIKVRDEPDVVMTARRTRHGPVISEILPGVPGADPATQDVLALSFPAAYRTDTTAAALLQLNRARNWNEFRDALTNWHAPMQNIVYADVDGNVGFVAPGLIPKRKSGDGWLPSPGWTGEYDWDGFVPFVDLPQVLNPPSGEIVNANNRIVPEDFPVFISRDWDGPYRARRIRELLDGSKRHDIVTSETILADVVSIFARELRPHLATVTLRNELSRRALAMLASWDGAIRRDRPEPLIFNAWMRQLTLALLRDEDKYDLSEYAGNRASMIMHAFDGTSAFCRDRVGGCTKVVADALATSLDDLSKQFPGDPAFWRWDSVHYAPFRHPLFESIPVVREFTRFRVPTDGDFFTVNRGATQFSDPREPFADIHGAGYRAIYDLSNLDNSRFIVAPGQSGHPLSAHWGDLLDLWSNGRHVTLAGTRAELAADGDTLTLAPR